eukprot:g19632.t1
MTSIVTARINFWHKREEGYVVYIIDVSFRGSAWVIEKRFNDFVTLQQGLSREFRDTDVGPLPKRRFFNRFDPQFLDERARDLQAFLGKALLKIQVTNSQHMVNFLEVAKHVNMDASDEESDEDFAAEYEQLEAERLERLVQAFQDRMIDSQSVRVEPRDDVEVEGRRQKLLKACNGFRDYDDHLKTFFNTEPNTKTQTATQAIDVFNTPYDQNFQNTVMSRAFELSSQTDTSGLALAPHQYRGGQGLVTSMGNI